MTKPKNIDGRTGNSNALQHGIYSNANVWPADAGKMKYRVNRYCRDVAALVLQVRGRIGPYEEALLHTLYSLTRAALLTLRWAAAGEEHDGTPITHEKRVAFLEKEVGFLIRRDDVLKRLGLDRLEDADGVDVLNAKFSTMLEDAAEGDE